MYNSYNDFLKQWSTNRHPQVKSGLLPVLVHEFNWDTAMAIHLHTIYGYFLAATHS